MSKLDSKPFKVLIVDDEEVIKEIIKDIILTEGLFLKENIFSTTDSQEALEIALKEKPDLIISDIIMPKMSGSELINKIREEKIKSQIIIITGYTDLDTAISVISHDISDLIRKPFKVEEILWAIKRVINKIELEKQNEEFKQRLYKAEKLTSVGLLAAGIAHEINNPNTFIKGNLELVEKYWKIIKPYVEKFIDENPDDKKLKTAFDQFPETVNSANNGSLRIKNIVKGLLSFTRNNSETLKSNVSIKDIIKEGLTLTSHRVKRHEVTIDIPENIKKININEQEIVQVFMNLIVNSIDAIEEKDERMKGLLTISVSDDLDNKVQTIILEDNGCGMDQKILDRMFDPFFSTKPQGKGTGLGMSITLGNIESNNGTLTCKSEKGKGTKFIISFQHALN